MRMLLRRHLSITRSKPLRKMTVANRDYHHLSHSEIDGAKRIYQHLSRPRALQSIFQAQFPTTKAIGQTPFRLLAGMLNPPEGSPAREGFPTHSFQIPEQCSCGASKHVVRWREGRCSIEYLQRIARVYRPALPRSRNLHFSFHREQRVFQIPSKSHRDSIVFQKNQ
jgi:hypothetical protein